MCVLDTCFKCTDTFKLSLLHDVFHHSVWLSWVLHRCEAHTKVAVCINHNVEVTMIFKRVYNSLSMVCPSHPVFQINTGEPAGPRQPPGDC